ncbi:phosphotransferase enzyme family protein [Alkalicoccobacillus porphyridii]|uniref:Phosphotransferase n=1 Tax=Alkalicoccobacillus porphyridii TaxID=2597270 RepID=A0A553ZW43_9BACI|nr:phosphotransferase [Alkalicoccobacillus porphyridii]TSB45652.1 phosphotransferase [Alkalicoccobacillus porphyridii]
MKEKVIKDAASCYGAELIKCLGGFTNQVYLLQQGQTELVLKAYRADQISYRQLHSKNVWMQALREKGMLLPLHIMTQDEKPILEREAGSEKYYFVAFSKVKGSIVHPEQWNKQLYYLWGQSLGKMHAVASTFNPPDEEFELPHWSTNPLVQFSHDDFDQSVLQQFQEMVDYSASLPISTKTFGITHNDYHHENFFIHRQQVIPIDFDDAQYSHFFYDLAVSIYHAVQVIKTKANKLDFLLEFLPHFFRGYESEHVSLDQFGDWKEQLPKFLSYRHLYSYVYLQLNLSNEMKNSLQPILEKMKKEILHQKPIVHLSENFLEKIRASVLEMDDRVKDTNVWNNIK